MEEIGLFCGINSLGIPFPKENKNHIGYFDIIKNQLEKRNYTVNAINISSLNKNCTWDLEKIITNNYNLKQISNIQIQSIDALRKINFLFKIIVPDKIKEKISIEKEKENIVFKDALINSDKTIFLYSAGPNDFFTFIGAGPVELLNSKTRKKLPKSLDALIDKTIDNIEKNINLLTRLNNNVQIYIFGFYYPPLFEIISKIIYLQEKMMGNTNINKEEMKNIIYRYNMLLEERCKRYDNVKYIDTAFLKDYCADMDFHPNTIGNQLLAQSIINEIDMAEASKLYNNSILK